MSTNTTLPPELLARVVAELTDQRFLRRKHYSRKTYDAGCRGPLCGLAQSDHKAARYAQRIGRPPRADVRRTQRVAYAESLVAYAAALQTVSKNSGGVV